jgi:hypothetical protein
MPEELAQCRREADELGGGIHMHLLETPYQRAWARREYGRPCAVELDRQGILGPNVSAKAQTEREKNPNMPEPEPDDSLEQIYEAELRRLEALEK